MSIVPFNHVYADANVSPSNGTSIVGATGGVVSSRIALVAVVFELPARSYAVAFIWYLPSASPVKLQDAGDDVLVMESTRPVLL